jgi:hypothetical protein
MYGMRLVTADGRLARAAKVPRALAKALAASADAAKRQGVDVRADMMRLGVRISQNNYVPEVTY